MKLNKPPMTSTINSFLKANLAEYQYLTSTLNSFMIEVLII